MLGRHYSSVLVIFFSVVPSSNYGPKKGPTMSRRLIRLVGRPRIYCCAVPPLNGSRASVSIVVRNDHLSSPPAELHLRRHRERHIRTSYKHSDLSQIGDPAPHRSARSSASNRLSRMNPYFAVTTVLFRLSNFTSPSVVHVHAPTLCQKTGGFSRGRCYPRAIIFHIIVKTFRGVQQSSHGCVTEVGDARRLCSGMCTAERLQSC